ncbi:unnamed protein product [Auanema sp. JU1783]|nr:unnamed protein product [Auanema sp. JU1783]
MGFWSKLRDYDAYRKPMDDFRVKTFSGGLVSIIAGILIIFLIFYELRNYFTVQTTEFLYVDATSSDARLDINFNITFHKLPCAFVTVDLMDVSGENQENIQHDIYKLPLDSEGKNISQNLQRIEANENKTHVPTESTTVGCGSCYGALPDGNCCNTCDEVKEAYQLKGWQMNLEEVEQCKKDNWVLAYAEHKGEGCQVYGTVQVAKVAGNFHIAPGDPYRTFHSHVHDLHSFVPTKFDCSHTINHFSFGNYYPGKAHPLDGRLFDEGRGGIMYQYYLKIVPTSYYYSNGTVEHSHQFSITSKKKDLSKALDGVTGFFVIYEFSPLMIHMEEMRKSIISFVVSLCAIVGGVFTVAQLIDSMIYRAEMALERKRSMNKLG